MSPDGKTNRLEAWGDSALFKSYSKLLQKRLSGLTLSFLLKGIDHTDQLPEESIQRTYQAR